MGSLYESGSKAAFPNEEAKTITGVAFFIIFEHVSGWSKYSTHIVLGHNSVAVIGFKTCVPQVKTL